MINSRNEVIDKIDDLLKYSKEQRPLHKYDEFVTPLKNKVIEYFNRDRSSLHKDLHQLQIQLFSDLYNRNTHYEPPLPVGLDDNFPSEYMDLSNMFYNFPLMHCSDSAFFNAWVYAWEDLEDEPQKDTCYWRKIEVEIETDDEDNETITYGDVIEDNNGIYIVASTKEFIYQKQIIVKNTLIDEWIDDVQDNGTVQKENDKINSLCDWLSNACANSYDYLLWEVDNLVVKSTNTKEIAQIVFIEKNFKKCVEYLNLPAHTPSYL